KGVYAAGGTGEFDPLTQDTSLQVSDASGPLLCATIGGEHWRRRGRNAFVFHDAAGSFAGGLGDGQFTRRPGGPYRFTARGTGRHRRPSTGRRLVFTLRVGNSCSQSSVELREQKRGLVTP